MDIRKTNAIRSLASLALIMLAVPASGSETQGAEVTARSVVANPCLTTTGGLSALRDIAREDAVETQQGAVQDRTDAVKIDADENAGMIEELIDLNGVPLVRLSDETDKKIYFGISFSGVVGVHGKL